MELQKKLYYIYSRFKIGIRLQDYFYCFFYSNKKKVFQNHDNFSSSKTSSRHLQEPSSSRPSIVFKTFSRRLARREIVRLGRQKNYTEDFWKLKNCLLGYNLNLTKMLIIYSIAACRLLHLSFSEIILKRSYTVMVIIL